MSACCGQRHNRGPCQLDADHRARGEHHFASDGKGGHVEWPCYALGAALQITRVSYCRSVAAFEVFGTAPLRLEP